MTSDKKKWQGEIVSKAGDKTVVVEIREEKRHKLYGKKFKKTKRYLVHDSDNVGKVGEQVYITESRPISKKKRWTLVELAVKDSKKSA